MKQLPVKEKKLKVKQKYFNFFVFVTKEHKTIFEERKGKGIWQGLYQFPLIETNKEVHLEDLDNLPEFQALVSTNAVIQLFNEDSIIHKLSHQHLFTKVWVLSTDHHQEALINWQEIELLAREAVATCKSSS